MTKKTHFIRWVALLVFLLPLLVGAGAYFFYPQSFLSLVRMRYEWNAGASAKVVEVDGYKIPYYEGGNAKGPVFVLIHGFGDSKISFLQAAKWLVSEYRVILPEVPGFGETQRDPKRNYSIRSQVKMFDKFFNKLGLKRFHIGGNSMGGHISAAYALAHPKKVLSLHLLNAAGLKTRAKIPYKPAKKPIKTGKDFDEFMSKIFYKKPHVPRPFKSYFIARAAKNFHWNNRITKDIREGKDYILNKRIHKLTMPTQVIWGDTDKLVHISIGKRYHTSIKGSRWVLMKKCGHSPQYERPEETAGLLRRFLLSLKK
mgnify:CR=1 FL=1